MERKTELKTQIKTQISENEKVEKIEKNIKPFATESFNLDHTKVFAPYIRLASKKIGKKGDVVCKYDIRFCQPNHEYMSTGEVHTLEHLMSEILHKTFENVIDISPMGCRTGFYLTMFDEVKEETMAQVIYQVMQKIAVWYDDIPGATIQTCGNAEDHDLEGARKRAMMFIGGIMSKGFGAIPEPKKNLD